jgi:hypothetical protein
MMPPQTAGVVSEMQAQREAPRPPMTIPEAIDKAEWLRRTPDGWLDPDKARETIITLLSALEVSPCYFKGAKYGIPTATFLAYDKAAHYALRKWAEISQAHGAPAAKYGWGFSLANEWSKRTDLKWPD